MDNVRYGRIITDEQPFSQRLFDESGNILHELIVNDVIPNAAQDRANRASDDNLRDGVIVEIHSEMGFTK